MVRQRSPINWVFYTGHKNDWASLPPNKRFGGEPVEAILYPIVLGWEKNHGPQSIGAFRSGDDELVCSRIHPALSSGRTGTRCKPIPRQPSVRSDRQSKRWPAIGEHDTRSDAGRH